MRNFSRHLKIKSPNQIVFSFVLLFLCTNSAYAESCSHQLGARNLLYEKEDPMYFTVLSWNGGDFVHCKKTKERDYSVKCGERIMSSDMQTAYDKSGQDWPVIWSGLSNQTMCYKKGENRYYEIHRKRYKGTIRGTNIELIRATGTETYFRIRRPNF